MGDIESGHKVRQHILNGDRLGQRANPAGANHHGQTFDKSPNELERETTPTDDYRRTKLDHLRRGLSQNPAHLVATSQVCRQVRPLLRQSTQIDDPADPGI